MTSPAKDAPSTLTRTPAVPPIVFSLYFLCRIALILATIWGLVTTAWWVLPLGVLCWYLVHIPFREVMESWASFQRFSTVLEETDTLLKGGLTREQETAIKKRLDCTSEDRRSQTLAVPMSDSKISKKRKVLISRFLLLFVIGGLLAINGNFAGAFTYWFFLAVVFAGLFFLL